MNKSNTFQSNIHLPMVSKGARVENKIKRKRQSN